MGWTFYNAQGQALGVGATGATGAAGATGATGAAGADGADGADGMSTAATPALTFDTTNAIGAAATAIRSDATIALFDATAPVTQAYGDAAAVGAAGVAARRDHKHGMPAAGLVDTGVITYLDGTVAAAPATPGAGTLRIYAKTGPALAVKDDAGNETVLGAGGGGSVATDAIWDSAGDLAVGTGANTAAKLAMGTALQVLRVNAGATALEYAAAGSGSGNMVNDGKPTIWTPPTSPATEDDEFGDASGQSGPVNGLDAKWSKINLGTSSWLKFDDSLAPGCAFFDIPTGQTAGQMIYQTTPAGDFTLLLRVTIGGCSDRQMWGGFIVDSAGTGISVMIDAGVGQAGPYFGLREMTTWVQNSNTTDLWYTSQMEIPARMVSLGLPVTLALRKASGVYYGSWSLSDRLILPPSTGIEVNRTPSAFTAAYVGFGRIGFGTGVGKVALDSFRIK